MPANIAVFKPLTSVTLDTTGFRGMNQCEMKEIQRHDRVTYCL